MWKWNPEHKDRYLTLREKAKRAKIKDREGENDGKTEKEGEEQTVTQIPTSQTQDWGLG